MSAHMLHARQNRILALRTIVARNAEPADGEPPAAMAVSPRRRPRFAVVSGAGTGNWQTEGAVAA